MDPFYNVRYNAPNYQVVFLCDPDGPVLWVFWQKFNMIFLFFDAFNGKVPIKA